MNKNIESEKWPILRTVEDMYGGDFLIKCGLFEGGFINFGYWKEINQKQVLSKLDRIESAKNLYRFVLNKMEILQTDSLLEVGCGAGVGSALALLEFDPHTIKGIDASRAQIERAKKLIQDSDNRLSFEIGAAEKIPCDKNCYDKVFSIEAAQHFGLFPAFINEVYRVLKSNGIFALATFFALQDEVPKETLEMIPTLRDNVDYLHSISKVRILLEEIGFEKIKIESIGEYVWHGFDNWIAHGDFKDSWDRNWYKGYKQGFFDYYLIVARKPS